MGVLSIQTSNSEWHLFERQASIMKTSNHHSQHPSSTRWVAHP